jgi:hypothetical protein
MSALNPLRHYPLKSPLRQKMKRKEEELDSIRAITFYLCYPAGKYLPASLTQHQSHASGIRSFRKFYAVITGKSNRLFTEYRHSLSRKHFQRGPFLRMTIRQSVKYCRFRTLGFVEAFRLDCRADYPCQQSTPTMIYYCRKSLLGTI